MVSNLKFSKNWGKTNSNQPIRTIFTIKETYLRQNSEAVRLPDEDWFVRNTIIWNTNK